MWGVIMVDDKVVVVCFGKSEIWDSRVSAEKYYFQCLKNAEGAKQQRYVSIYTKLKAGMKVCTDLNYNYSEVV